MNVKNKIITISGEPVTGKGTNVKVLEEKLMKRGYKKENIHIITTGHIFRDYFNTILEFINNIDNDNILKELYKKDEIKEIFKNESYKTKFIESISKIKASKKFVNSTISIEQANNIQELSEIRNIVDNIIDGNMRKKGIEINKEKRLDEIWIIDSRLAFQNIPESFAVRLTCRPDIAGKRLFQDNTRGKEDNKYKSLKEAIEQREKRKNGEIKRYKEKYGVDLTDENNYNLIIDTSFSTIEDISNTILTCLDNYYNNEKVVKKWTSPKTLIPTQTGRQTYFESISGYTLEQMQKIIQKDGYNQNYPVEVVEVDDVKFINDGHHRNFATGRLGKTLIPYITIAKDDEFVNATNISARKIAESIRISDIYDHEELYGKDFRYKNIYPNYFEKLIDTYIR